MIQIWQKNITDPLLLLSKRTSISFKIITLLYKAKKQHNTKASHSLWRFSFVFVSHTKGSLYTAALKTSSGRLAKKQVAYGLSKQNLKRTMPCVQCLWHWIEWRWEHQSFSYSVILIRDYLKPCVKRTSPRAGQMSLSLGYSVFIYINNICFFSLKLEMR